MMNEKGDIGVKQIIFAVIALLVIAGTLYGGTSAYDKFGFYFGLIDYNASLGVSEVNRVGIDMSNGKLKYFTGTKWKEIDEKQPAFILNEFEFSPAGLSKGIINFYGGKRDPEILYISASVSRYWIAIVKPISVLNLGIVSVYSHTKKGLPGSGTIYSSSIDHNDWFVESLSYNLNFLEDEAYNSKGLMKRVLDWRDQILEGGICEKFMGFKLDKIDGKENSGKINNYKVKKRFDYIYIDLNEDVIGESQKFKEGCFKYENYENIKVDWSDWVNDVQIDIEVDYEESVNAFGLFPREHSLKVKWKPDIGWEFEASNLNDWKNYLLGSDEVFSDFKISNEFQKDFVKGLNELTSIKSYHSSSLARGLAGRDTTSIVVRTRLADGGGRVFYEIESLDENENKIKTFNELLIQEYIRHLRPPENVPIPIPVPTLPDYFFFVEDINSGTSAKLLDSSGEDKKVSLSNGFITSGSLTFGSIDTTSGIITIDYTSTEINLDLIPYINFINGKNFFDIIYRLDPGQNTGYSKLSRNQIPVGILGVSV